MKKIIIYKGLSIGILAFLLLFLTTYAFKLCVKKELRLVEAYVAARDIPPRTQINETDLLAIEVPKNMLMDYAYGEKAEIIGMYTDIQGMIPAGSLFYKNMLHHKEELPDNPTTQLRKGQAAYSLEIDLAKMGGSIVAGQRVDVYASFTEMDRNVLSGLLLENVRVLAIKDYKGLDLDDPQSTQTPYLAILAIDVEDVELLSKAEKMGDVKMVASSKTYDANLEAIRASNSDALEYLTQQANKTNQSEEGRGQA